MSLIINCTAMRYHALLRCTNSHTLLHCVINIVREINLLGYYLLVWAVLNMFMSSVIRSSLFFTIYVNVLPFPSLFLPSSLPFYLSTSILSPISSFLTYRQPLQGEQQCTRCCSSGVDHGQLDPQSWRMGPTGSPSGGWGVWRRHVRDQCTDFHRWYVLYTNTSFYCHCPSGCVVQFDSAFCRYLILVKPSRIETSIELLRSPFIPSNFYLFWVIRYLSVCGGRHRHGQCDGG